MMFELATSIVLSDYSVMVPVAEVSVKVVTILQVIPEYSDRLIIVQSGGV